MNKTIYKTNVKWSMIFVWRIFRPCDFLLEKHLPWSTLKVFWFNWPCQVYMYLYIGTVHHHNHLCTSSWCQFESNAYTSVIRLDILFSYLNKYTMRVNTNNYIQCNKQSYIFTQSVNHLYLILTLKYKISHECKFRYPKPF